MYTCTVCYDDIIIQEVCTEELQAAGDVKEIIQQLQQADITTQLQTERKQRWV